jgi:hypothetical protein
MRSTAISAFNEPLQIFTRLGHSIHPVSLTTDYVIVFLTAVLWKFRCGELVSIELQSEPPLKPQLSTDAFRSRD